MSWQEWGCIQEGPRRHFSAVKINHHLVLAIGGRTDLNDLSNCDIWDVKAKKWSSAPSLPIPMKFCRGTKLGRYVYVIGAYKDFLRLDIKKMERGWKILPAAKVDGLGCELVSDDQYIYRIGDNEGRTSFHRFLPESKVWEILPKMEVGRDFFGAASFDGKIYVTGGRTGHSGDRILSSVSIYDTTRQKWRSGPNIPKRIYNHSAVAVGNFLFVSGGQHSCGSESLTTCYVLNVETKEWFESNSSLPHGFSGHSSTSFGSNVFIIGGSSEIANGINKTVYTTDVQYLPLGKCYSIHGSLSTSVDAGSSFSSISSVNSGSIQTQEVSKSLNSKATKFSKQANHTSIKSSTTHSTGSDSTIGKRLRSSRNSIYRTFSINR